MDNLGFGSGSPYAVTNPYLDKSVNDAQAATTRAYNNTTAPAYTSAMVRSGSFGNSGLAQAQNDATRQYQDTLGKQSNDMYSNQYQFGQQLGQNQNQFNLNFDRGTYNDAFNHNQTNYQNGMNLIGMQNGSNQQNLGFGSQIQNTPMNYYQGFSNTANAIGNGFGTDSKTSFAPGSGIAGALGGAQIGANLQSKYGSQIGNFFGGTPNGYTSDNRYSGGNDGYTNYNGESFPT